MGKLRHIALSVEDPWATAEFYMNAFGMKKVGEIDASFVLGVYLSDGVINMAILKYKTDLVAGPRGKDFVGIHHMGFWVDDIAAAQAHLNACGATHFSGEAKEDNSFYEIKYTDPDGIIVDITASGWGGASKDGRTQDAARRLDNPELKADRSQLKPAVTP